MMNLTNIGILLSLLSVLYLPQNAEARDSYSNFYRKLKATSTKNWNKDLLNRPVSERIEPLSDLALEYNMALNRRDNFKMVPKPQELPPKTKKMLLSELKNLPKSLRNFMQKHVIAIYTAVDIGGTAMAGSVYNSKGIAEFGFIILDLSMIDKKANEWATYKENTVFAPVKGYKLSVTLEHPKHNTKAATIRYLILHEIGHIFHAVQKLQPAYIDLNWQDADFEPYPFNKPELTRKFALGEDYYPLYERISFYRPLPPFDLDDAEEVYEWLQETSFPSLYGSVNALEDFAETFATYIHTSLLKKPHKVTLKKGRKTLLTIDQKVLDKELVQKTRIIEENLKSFATEISP